MRNFSLRSLFSLLVVLSLACALPAAWGAPFPTASTEEVVALVEKGSGVLVDARHPDIYNGWALDGLPRGGHIRGATDFSHTFLTVAYDEENNLEKKTRDEVLNDTLLRKGLRPGTRVVVYDTNEKDAPLVAEFLRSKGIEDVSLYNAKLWVYDRSRELVSWPAYELLVPAEIVRKIAEGNVPAGFTSARAIKIFNVNWGDEEGSGYRKGHVPTAVHINTDSIEPPQVFDDAKRRWVSEDESDSIKKLWKLPGDEVLLKLLLDNGITEDTCVIATSPEPMAAARFAVVCRYMGVRDVRLMNMGLEGWKLAGYPLATDSVQPVPASAFGERAPESKAWIDSIDEVAEKLGTEGFTLVDNRTREEFLGEISGYSYHNIAGRIEGAVYGCAGERSSSSMYYYRNIDKSMRNGNEILALWKELGIDTGNHLSFMCGSGWRVSEILWYARVMGLNNTSIYSDGWIAWSDEGRPFVTGEPAAK